MVSRACYGVRSPDKIGDPVEGTPVDPHTRHTRRDASTRMRLSLFRPSSLIANDPAAQRFRLFNPGRLL